jgi:uncharacterized protein (TIGR02646 family)
MIRIDRRSVPAPSALSSAPVRADQERIASFFRLPPEKRGQKRYEFDTRYLWAREGEVRTALFHLFRNKCAYCESQFLSHAPNLEHFRPKTNARDARRATVDPDHYWWLFYEWENLYLVCQDCNVNKRDQFPVAGERAPAGAVGVELLLEEPLLLDPCGDDPARHLKFLEDGRVEPRAGGKWARALTTIETLGLNRDALIAARAEAARETRTSLEESRFEEVAHRLLDLGNSYLAVRHAAVLSLMPKLRDRMPDELLKKVGADKRPSVHVEAEPDAHASENVAAESIRTTYVKKVEIENFRAIRELALEFHPEGVAVRTAPQPAPESIPTSASADRVGWKVLLGENGAGKSSVVHAICVALAGKTHARRWLKGREMLRRPSTGEPPPRHGSVTLHLSRGEVIAFEIDGGRVRFTSGAEGAGTFLRAYGATRLLPSPRTRRVPVPDVVQIENLFNPFTPLHHADRWLAGLSEHRFNVAARTLKDLLRMDPSRDLLRDPGGRVLVPDEAGVPVPLHQLSDGYQTVIALAVDIMAGLPKVEEDYRWSPGIVLLDELGTHLHPRWRMVIVESLRNAFSSMQFIATTHEPLCLRGLRDGEIAVMARDGDSVAVLTELPSPERLRIDQLLTSPFFGLHTTIDPEIDRQFQEYYDLLATPDLAPELEVRRDWLRDQLSRFGVLGYTRRDQLMYEVVDRYLARAQKKGKTLTTLPLSAKKELVKIWRRVGTMRETAR